MRDPYLCIHPVGFNPINILEPFYLDLLSMQSIGLGLDCAVSAYHQITVLLQPPSESSSFKANFSLPCSNQNSKYFHSRKSSESEKIQVSSGPIIGFGITDRTVADLGDFSVASVTSLKILSWCRQARFASRVAELGNVSV